MGRRKARFDWLELAVMGLVVAALVSGFYEAVTPRSVNEELEPIAAQYGPSHNSTNDEEWAIRDFFHDRRDGVFVDIGANEYRKYSNTYYLETVLGWSGLAVEPLREFEGDWQRYRPRSRFLPFFISDTSNEEARMYYVGRNPSVTSSQKAFAEQWGPTTKEVTAPTITLNDLLMREGVEHFDLLTMDIELAEPKALAGFDIERYRPALVCIEAHPQVRQQILDYFAGHRYVLVGKYLRAEPYNLYFAPVGETGR